MDRRPTPPPRAVRRALSLREQGWTLAEIAAAVGVSEMTVSRWCRGMTRRDIRSAWIEARRESA